MVVASALLSVAHAATPTTTTLAAISVSAGNVVILTASVLAGNVAISSGQINFCDALATYCTDIHLLGTAQLTSAGTAMLKLRPVIGTHRYKAVFVGTAAHASSTSGTSTITVSGPEPTTTVITQRGTLGNYTLMATVTGSGLSTAPTGMVSFLDTLNSNYVVGIGSLGPGALAQSFAPQASYAAGSNALGTAVGDFNGDGMPDLVTTHQSSNTISVLLGKGDGSFQSQVAYTTGDNPGEVAVGDFNGDGIPDLVTANNGDNTVSVLLGKGDGTFQRQVAYPAGNNPGGVAVADFNGDGIPDLVAANNGTNTVSVLLGRGDGTFQMQVAYPVGSKPGEVAVGDFNRDGITDLVTANNEDSTISVLLGNGDGTFQTRVNYATGLGPYGVAVGDFNGDGIPDLVVANLSDNTISVLLGKGDGTFQPQITYRTRANPYGVAVGDFNEDGVPDLVTANNGDNTVSVLLGNGDGTFQSQITYGTGMGPLGIAVSDFNGDGIPDLDVANLFDSTVSVLLGQVTDTATASVSGIGIVGAIGATHTVEASYPGDASYAASISDLTTLAAEPVTTALSLSSTPMTSNYGQQVVLAARVTPYTAQGYVTNNELITFYEGDTRLGTGTLSSGLATLDVTSLPLGAHGLSAAYAGDTDFLASTSNALSYNVSQLKPTITVAARAANYGTSTTTLTAEVAYAGNSAPTGLLSFMVDEGPSVAATCTGFTSPLTCTATFALSALAAGVHLITATEASDITYASAVGTTTLTLNQVAPTINWTIPSPIIYGAALGKAQLNASSTVPGMFVYSPTVGTVLTAGAHTLSVAFTPADTTDYSLTTETVQVTVTQATPTINWTTPSPTIFGTALSNLQLNASSTVSGMFVYSPAVGTVLSAGTHTLSATFTPTDTTDLVAVMTSTTLIVNQHGSATSIALSSNSLTPGQALTITAAATGVSGGAPTGSITLLDDTTALGTFPLTNGGVSRSMAALMSGTHVLSATYNGDLNYLASTAAAAVNVAALDFSLASSGGTSRTVSPGDFTTYTFALNPTYTVYPGTVSFTVTGLPNGSIYTMTPSMVLPTGGAQSAVMTVQTVRHTARYNSRTKRDYPPVMLGVLFFPLVAPRRVRGRLVGILLTVTGLAGMAALTGCGTIKTPYLNQVESYTVTVTATSGTVSHSSTVTLNEQ